MTETPTTEPYPGDADHRVMCRQVVDLLADFSDGQLPPSLHEDVARHLAACPECAEFAEQLRTTAQLLGVLPAPDVLPTSLVDSLVATFRDVVGRQAPSD